MQILSKMQSFVNFCKFYCFSIQSLLFIITENLLLNDIKSVKQILLFFYDEMLASTPLEVSSFADCFRSYFERESDQGGNCPQNFHSPINFCLLLLLMEDVEDDIRQTKFSTQTGVDGISSYLLKNWFSINL